jgi:hypothetical protein
MKRLIIPAVLSILIAASASWAAADNAGTSGAVFLKIGVGARAAGMGEAYVAVPEGADSLYWNPAGLTNLGIKDITFTHNEWIDDVRYEYVGASIPLFGNSAVGFSYSQLTMGELEGRDAQGRPTADFTAGDRLFTVGWGIRPFSMLQAGATFKYISSNIADDNAKAYAGDFGAIFRPPLEGLSVGFAVHNVGTEIKFVNEGDPLPLTYRIGGGYTLPFGGRTHKITVAVDGVKGNDTEFYVNTGTEYWLANMVAVRAGYKARYDEAGVTAGGGFRYLFSGSYGVQVDYAYADMGTFGATHRVSVAALLGAGL